MSSDRDAIGALADELYRQVGPLLAECSEPSREDYVAAIHEALAKADTILSRGVEPTGEAEPVAVTIFCPGCAVPHVDEGEWATTRQHKTHQCQGCGHEWRPFPFATVGVAHPSAAEAPSVDQRADSRLRSVVAMLERVSGPTASVRVYEHEAKAILAALTPQGADKGPCPKGDADQIERWAKTLYEANDFYEHGEEGTAWEDMASPDGGIRDLHGDMARAAHVVWTAPDAISPVEQGDK